MRISILTAAVTVASLAGGASAQLAKLDSLINVDNEFNAYISDDPNVLGTEFSSGTSWPTTYSGTYTFNNAGTFYIHVRAVDLGPPAMFLATMKLTDDLGHAAFANGTGNLVSNIADWTVSTALGSGDVVPHDFGANGTSGTWGIQTLQSPDAHYLWHPLLSQVSTAYFTATIRVVPTPGALSVVALAPLGLRRRRR